MYTKRVNLWEITLWLFYFSKVRDIEIYAEEITPYSVAESEECTKFKDLLSSLFKWISDNYM